MSTKGGIGGMEGEVIAGGGTGAPRSYDLVSAPRGFGPLKVDLRNSDL